MKKFCKSIGCSNEAVGERDFCDPCRNKEEPSGDGGHTRTLAERYPSQYRSLGDMAEIDIFGVLHLFGVQDPSGCVQFAVKRLLIGSKPTASNVKEARDALTRWLQLNQETVTT